jgi:hypothetical protein
MITKEWATNPSLPHQAVSIISAISGLPRCASGGTASSYITQENARSYPSLIQYMCFLVGGWVVLGTIFFLLFPSGLWLRWWSSVQRFILWVKFPHQSLLSVTNLYFLAPHNLDFLHTYNWYKLWGLCDLNLWFCSIGKAEGGGQYFSPETNTWERPGLSWKKTLCSHIRS